MAIQNNENQMKILYVGSHFDVDVDVNADADKE